MERYGTTDLQEIIGGELRETDNVWKGRKRDAAGYA